MLLDQIHEHVPLSPVAGRTLQEEGHEATIGPLARTPVGDLDHGVEEVVAPLHLVPEEQVRLAELEIVNVVFLHEGNSDRVEGGEEPAASRSLLVRHGLCLVHLKCNCQKKDEK